MSGPDSIPADCAAFATIGSCAGRQIGPISHARSGLGLPRGACVSFHAAARRSFYASVFALSACAGSPAQPDIVAHVIQAPPVKIMVPIACLNAADIPQAPATAFTPDATEWSAAQEEARAGRPDRLYTYVNRLTQQAIADVNALDAYVLRVQPLLAACAAQPEVSK